MSRTMMRAFIITALVLSTLPAVFAGNNDHHEKIPVFTNQDLKRYHDKSVTGPELYDQHKKEDSFPLSLKKLDSETIFNKNNGAVVAIVSYNKEGIPFSHGSGFIVTQDGSIVTSYHVISNAYNVKVRADDKLLNVEGVIHKDEENDIAVLKVDGMNLQTVELGDSSKAETGETVYVISSPGGTENILSEGKLRGIEETGYSIKKLRISSTIAMGSSGGPVFNTSGEVIGIATSMIDGISNISFAVPINLIKNKISSQKIISLQEALSEDYKRSAYFWFNHANDLNRTGRYKDAVEAYKKAIHLNRELTSAYNGLGVAFMKLEKYKEAVESYQQALELEPDSAWVHSNLGLAYTESGMYNDAVDEFIKAIRIIPELLAAHFNLGIAYRKLKQYKNALEAFNQALSIKSDSADVRFVLGITYLNLKDRASAKEEYILLKDLDPELARKLLNMIN